MEVSREEINSLYLKLLNVTHDQVLRCDCLKLPTQCNCGLREMIEEISEFLTKFKDQNYYK